MRSILVKVEITAKNNTKVSKGDVTSSWQPFPWLSRSRPALSLFNASFIYFTTREIDVVYELKRAGPNTEPCRSRHKHVSDETVRQLR